MPSQIEVTRARILSEIEDVTQRRRALEIQLVSLQHFLDLLATPAKPAAGAPRGKPGSVELKVRQVFADKPGGIAIDTLIGESGCAASSVRAAVRRGVAAREIIKDGDDLYTLVGPAGSPDLLAVTAQS